MSTLRGIIAITVVTLVLTTLSPPYYIGAAPARSTIQIAMYGELSAAPQNLRGSIDDRYITAQGDYTLVMGLDLTTLSCPPQPGRIPWEAGLVAYVQNNTPRVGSLDLKYDKLLEPDQGHIDAWVTNIDPYVYQVQVFRWSSATWVKNSDGSTTVSYRGGSIAVFKKQRSGGTAVATIISRELCFGNYVDYDLIAR